MDATYVLSATYYEESVSQYLQDALVEAMMFDIEEGNFSDREDRGRRCEEDWFYSTQLNKR
jgi:hypothetical protein